MASWPHSQTIGPPLATAYLPPGRGSRHAAVVGDEVTVRPLGGVVTGAHAKSNRAARALCPCDGIGDRCSFSGSTHGHYSHDWPEAPQA